MDVLIVDNHPMALRCWMQELEKAGIRYDVATSVDAAFTQLEEFSYDCVIFDTAIPPGKMAGECSAAKADEHAGLTFAQAVRSVLPDMPLVCFGQAKPRTGLLELTDPSLGVRFALRSSIVPYQLPRYLRDLVESCAKERRYRDQAAQDKASRKPYTRPTVVSEQMFETAALECSKCTAGPFPQFACGSLPQVS